jgi:hypothetical protein
MQQSLLHLDANRIWVLDRCSDNSENTLNELGERYIKTDASLIGRQTSYCRNLGLAHCHNDADILFLDGDRFVASGNLATLTSWDKDIALLTLEDDYRNSFTDYGEHYGQVFNCFFSCGIFFKRSAINKILDFQNGEFFRTDLQQDWGIEDTYLGDVAFHLQLSADIYKDAVLNGKFEKDSMDNANVLVKRFNERNKLNVLW